MPKLIHYSAEAKAEALVAVVAHEGNVLAASKAIGIPESSIRRWIQTAEGEVADEIRRIGECKQSALKDRFAGLADEMLDIVQAKRDQLSPRDAMICAAICVDKMRLLAGEPTVISENRSDGRHAELEARYGNARNLLLVVQPQPDTLAPPHTEQNLPDGDQGSTPTATNAHSTGPRAPICGRRE